MPFPLATAPPLLVAAAFPSLGTETVVPAAATATGLVWSGGSGWLEAAAGMTGFTAWLEATNASMALYKNKISSCK